MDMNLKKMTPKEKVYLLEQTVLSGTSEMLRDIIAQGAPFAFTARALGLACGYGGYEKVKIMFEAGMHFDFEYNSSLKSKYGGAYVSGVGTVYPACYWLMLADMGHKVYLPTLCAYAKDLHYGPLPEINIPLLPAQERARIAKYLLQQKCLGLPADKLLFFAILWNNSALIEILKEQNVTLGLCNALTETEASITRNEAFETMLESDADSLLAVLSNFREHLPAPMVLTQKLFNEKTTPFADGRILQFAVEHTDVSKLTKSALLKLAVDHQAVNAMAAMAAGKWIKTVKACDDMIQYASECEKNDALSWLLEYKNKTFDLKKEQIKAEKKQEKELNATPDAVSELKKIWAFKKMPDGGLMITSYKGTETDLKIPAAIGKNPVTVIGEWAFSPEASRLTDEQRQARRNLRTVIVPEGVTCIDSCAFYGCSVLETVSLPKTLLKIGNSAFFECLALRAIVLPENLEKVGGSAFDYCTDLKEISFGNPDTIYGFDAFGKCRWYAEQPDGCVYAGNALLCYKDGGTSEAEQESVIIIRDGTTSIAPLVFSFYEKNIEYIKIPESVTEIGAENFKNNQKTFGKFDYIPIHAPSGSFAEQYAKENNIPFVAE